MRIRFTPQSRLVLLFLGAYLLFVGWACPRHDLSHVISDKRQPWSSQSHGSWPHKDVRHDCLMCQMIQSCGNAISSGVPSAVQPMLQGLAHSARDRTPWIFPQVSILPIRAPPLSTPL